LIEIVFLFGENIEDFAMNIGLHSRHSKSLSVHFLTVRMFFSMERSSDLNGLRHPSSDRSEGAAEKEPEADK
jgi:hypothetical protein